VVLSIVTGIYMIHWWLPNLIGISLTYWWLPNLIGISLVHWWFLSWLQGLEFSWYPAPWCLYIVADSLSWLNESFPGTRPPYVCTILTEWEFSWYPAPYTNVEWFPTLIGWVFSWYPASLHPYSVACLAGTQAWQWGLPRYSTWYLQGNLSRSTS
jgi:hypothetical protein